MKSYQNLIKTQREEFMTDSTFYVLVKYTLFLQKWSNLDY